MKDDENEVKSDANENGMETCIDRPDNNELVNNEKQEIKVIDNDMCVSEENKIDNDVNVKHEVENDDDDTANSTITLDTPTVSTMLLPLVASSSVSENDSLFSSVSFVAPLNSTITKPFNINDTVTLKSKIKPSNGQSVAEEKDDISSVVVKGELTKKILLF